MWFLLVLCKFPLRKMPGIGWWRIGVDFVVS